MQTAPPTRMQTAPPTRMQTAPPTRMQTAPPTRMQTAPPTRIQKKHTGTGPGEVEELQPTGAAPLARVRCSLNVRYESVTFRYRNLGEVEELQPEGVAEPPPAPPADGLAPDAALPAVRAARLPEEGVGLPGDGAECGVIEAVRAEYGRGLNL